jgi:hypothetical protein
MASEMRRLAKLLVERRTDAFASRYPRRESEQRVKAAMEGFAPKGMVYDTAWRDEAGATFLDVTFAPARGTRWFLNSASLVLATLVGATLWAFIAPGEPAGARILIAIVTLLAILAFPFVVTAYGSRRDAEEATLRRRIRRAIVEEEHR